MHVLQLQCARIKVVHIEQGVQTLRLPVKQNGQTAMAALPP